MPLTEPLDLEPIKRGASNRDAVVIALIAEVERLRAMLTSVIQINDALLQDVADLRAAEHKEPANVITRQ